LGGAQVWHVMSLLHYTVRFRLYGQVKVALSMDNPAGANPLLVGQVKLTIGETKKIMRRISKVRLPLSDECIDVCRVTRACRARSERAGSCSPPCGVGSFVARGSHRDLICLMRTGPVGIRVGDELTPPSRDSGGR
jgi:hypothetical protein